MPLTYGTQIDELIASLRQDQTGRLNRVENKWYLLGRWLSDWAATNVKSRSIVEGNENAPRARGVLKRQLKSVRGGAFAMRVAREPDQPIRKFSIF